MEHSSHWAGINLSVGPSSPDVTSPRIDPNAALARHSGRDETPSLATTHAHNDKPPPLAERGAAARVAQMWPGVR